jgi:hypothetical protein
MVALTRRLLNQELACHRSAKSQGSVEVRRESCRRRSVLLPFHQRLDGKIIRRAEYRASDEVWTSWRNSETDLLGWYDAPFGMRKTR